jgi:hypothetical protein
MKAHAGAPAAAGGKGEASGKLAPRKGLKPSPTIGHARTAPAAEILNWLR